MSFTEHFSLRLTFIVFLTPLFCQAQSAYDPPTSQTFSQATAGMQVINSYTFGTANGNNITNLTQLSGSFQPYGVAKTTVINEEWERYQQFNSTNFAFESNALDLTATIPSGGGLSSGGIYSGQIWSNQTYQPGITGHEVYAISARIKIPNGTGMWPAFWLMSPSNSDASEVDIMEIEVMQNQNQYDWTGFDHGPGAAGNIYSILSNPWTWHPGTDFSAAYHNYQTIWTEDATYKYVDDELIYAQFFRWTASTPAQIGINLAVGSSEPFLPGLIPNSLSEFPSKLQVASLTVLGNTVTIPPTASVSYIGQDTTTQGNWTGVYGQDGYVIPDDTTSAPPSYATVTTTDNSIYVWSASTTDVRAPQISPGSSNRYASAYFAYGAYNVDVSMTDGNTHRVSLYLLDWDTSRSETITIRDARTQTVLYTQVFSNFHYGVWVSWNIKGNVTIEASPVSGSSPVISAVMFGSAGSAPPPPPPPPPPSTSKATFVGFDATTQGNWTGKYGADGFLIPNDTNSSVPSYATVSTTGASIYEWTAYTTDPRALQSWAGATGTNRFASTYLASSSFSINLDLTDGKAHQVAVYFLDWDQSRTETIQIVDAVSQAVLSTESVSNFHNGLYGVWTIQGNVIIQALPTTYAGPLVSSLFFGQ